MKQAIAVATTLSDHVMDAAHSTADAIAHRIGQIAAPIAAQPPVQWIAKIPGLDWLLLWLGQVDHAQALADVEQLRQTRPTATAAELAQKIVQDMTWRSAQVGLLTNIVPPVALALLAVDIAAVTKIQADMVYRIAAAYGLPLDDPQRRGEVIALYGVAFGSGTPLKVGTSFLELIPGIGAATGAVTNGVLIYGLGTIAQQFYERKVNQVSSTRSS